MSRARRENRRLVQQVLQVRAGEASGLLGERPHRDAGIDGLALRMHLEDRLAAMQVGFIQDHLAVEAARAQQRGIEHVRAVGRGHDDHVGVGIEAVHLDEESG